MGKIIFLALFIGVVGFLPVYVLDTMVTPELTSMKNTYESFDKAADDIANGQDVKLSSDRRIIADEMSSSH